MPTFCLKIKYFYTVSNGVIIVNSTGMELAMITEHSLGIMLFVLSTITLRHIGTIGPKFMPYSLKLYIVILTIIFSDHS